MSAVLYSLILSIMRQLIWVSKLGEGAQGEFPDGTTERPMRDEENWKKLLRTLWGKKCCDRELNPGLSDGNAQFYH